MSKKIPVSIRFDPVLLERLDSEAENRGMNRTALIEHLLNRALVRKIVLEGAWKDVKPLIASDKYRIVDQDQHVNLTMYIKGEGGDITFTPTPGQDPEKRP